MSRVVLVAVAVAAAIAAAAGPPLLRMWQAQEFRQALQRDLQAVRRAGEQALAQAGTLIGEEEVRVRHLEGTLLVVRRHAALAPAGEQRRIEILETLYSDLLALQQEVVQAWHHKTELRGIAMVRYADDAVAARAIELIEHIAVFVENRRVRVEEMRTRHQQLIAGSGYDLEDRADLWQPMQATYEHLLAATQLEAEHAQNVRAAIPLVRYLNANKGHWRVDEEGKLLFTDWGRLGEYRDLLFRARTGLESFEDFFRNW